MMNPLNEAVTGGTVQYINPTGLIRNDAFTQVVAVSGPVKTIHVGAQNAVDGSGTIVGRGDIAAQTEQVLRNIQTCLEACGAGPEHLIQWRIYITQGQPIQQAFGVFQRWWGGRPDPPANTVLFVSGFMPPDFLLAIEAIAVIPA